MKVKQSEYVASAVSSGQYPLEGFPEIALVGRSNVGKSSFINRLLGRKNLARTSSRPGKTQVLNFYRINQSFYLVDLPGYGYAQVSKSIQATWGKMADEYLLHREPLKLIVQLLDIRHPPSRQDVMMWDWLKTADREVLHVATKCDKVSKNRRPAYIHEIKRTLGLPEHRSLPLFSALTGEGKEEVWQEIEKYCKM